MDRLLEVARFTLEVEYENVSYVGNCSAVDPATDRAAEERIRAELADRRFMVRTRRGSTLLPAVVGSRKAADHLAVQWETRFGEDFVTVDTWEAA